MSSATVFVFGRTLPRLSLPPRPRHPTRRRQVWSCLCPAFLSRLSQSLSFHQAPRAPRLRFPRFLLVVRLACCSAAQFLSRACVWFLFFGISVCCSCRARAGAGTRRGRGPRRRARRSEPRGRDCRPQAEAARAGDCPAQAEAQGGREQARLNSLPVPVCEQHRLRATARHSHFLGCFLLSVWLLASPSPPLSIATRTCIRGYTGTALSFHAIIIWGYFLASGAGLAAALASLSISWLVFSAVSHSNVPKKKILNLSLALPTHETGVHTSWRSFVT